MSWVRHPGRFRCSLDSFLYGFITSRAFAEMVGVTTKTVMAWRDRTSGPSQAMVPRYAYAIHRIIEQQIIPPPRCITKLNKLMGYTASKTAA